MHWASAAGCHAHQHRLCHAAPILWILPLLLQLLAQLLARALRHRDALVPCRDARRPATTPRWRSVELLLLRWWLLLHDKRWEQVEVADLAARAWHRLSEATAGRAAERERQCLARSRPTCACTSCPPGACRLASTGERKPAGTEAGAIVSGLEHTEPSLAPALPRLQRLRPARRTHRHRAQ